MRGLVLWLLVGLLPGCDHGDSARPASGSSAKGATAADAAAPAVPTVVEGLVIPSATGLFIESGSKSYKLEFQPDCRYEPPSAKTGRSVSIRKGESYRATGLARSTDGEGAAKSVESYVLSVSAFELMKK